MAVTLANDGTFPELLKSHRKVVVKYYADWCGSCRLFAPKYKRMSDDERFKDVLFLEINAEENPQARDQAGVNNLPFFAVFKDGQLVKGDFTAKEETVVGMIESLNA
jgi:thioredoxin 1